MKVMILSRNDHHYIMPIDRDLLSEALKICASKHTSLDVYLRLQIRRLVQYQDPYGLEDTIRFGKYKDEPIEDIIKCDPAYVVWLQENVSGFCLTPEAESLLEVCIPEEGFVVRKRVEEQTLLIHRKPEI